MAVCTLHSICLTSDNDIEGMIEECFSMIVYASVLLIDLRGGGSGGRLFFFLFHVEGELLFRLQNHSCNLLTVLGLAMLGLPME